MAVQRVALQAAVAQLAIGKIFADANGLLISSNGVKIVSFTRDMTLASGNQSIVGVGFKPTSAIFLAIRTATNNMSIGYDDGVKAMCILDSTPDGAGTYGWNTTQSIFAYQAGAVTYSANVLSWDADGCTLAWSKQGATAGTFNIIGVFKL